MSEMRFQNFGGSFQFVVTGEDELAAIEHLDAARWAATSAPLRDLRCDPALLPLLDPEGTGRLRVHQLIAARDWLFARLARRGSLGSEVLVLDQLDPSQTALRTAALAVIREHGLGDNTRLPLTEIRKFNANFLKLPANGDGVVPPGLIADAELSAFAADILATSGGSKDIGGDEGVAEGDLARFQERARVWLDWRAREAEASHRGGETGGMSGCIEALNAKIEEFFWHCDLLRQQANADQLRLSAEELRAMQARDTAAIEQYLSAAPLATPTAEGQLTVDTEINPIYAASFEALRVQVLAVEGLSAFDRDAWRALRAIFAPFRAWQAEKPPEPFEAVGADKLNAYLAGDHAARLTALIAADKAAEAEIAPVRELEQVALYQRWLVEIANNFVNFSAIYRKDQTALVEVGSLVMDGRRLDFCMKVLDHGGHKAVASLSGVFLVYAQIFAKEGGPALYEIVAPLTGGERGRLRVGKRGLFIDLDGAEWDAVICDLVENPISVKEAAFAPFRKASEMVGRKISEWIGSKQAAQESAMMASAEGTVAGAQAKVETVGKAPPEAPPPEAPKKGLDVNTLVIGGSLAIAGVGALVAGMISVLTSISGWIAILGVVGVVMGISALVGWIRLRRRDMGLLMEASGWAINLHMRLNLRIARVFAFTPALPEGAVLDPTDQLATPEDHANDGRSVLYVILSVVIIAAALVAFRVWLEG